MGVYACSNPVKLPIALSAVWEYTLVENCFSAVWKYTLVQITNCTSAVWKYVYRFKSPIALVLYGSMYTGSNPAKLPIALVLYGSIGWFKSCKIPNSAHHTHRRRRSRTKRRMRYAILDHREPDEQLQMLPRGTYMHVNTVYLASLIHKLHFHFFRDILTTLLAYNAFMIFWYNFRLIFCSTSTWCLASWIVFAKSDAFQAHGPGAGSFLGFHPFFL